MSTKSKHFGGIAASPSRLAAASSSPYRASHDSTKKSSKNAKSPKKNSNKKTATPKRRRSRSNSRSDSLDAESNEEDSGAPDAAATTATTDDANSHGSDEEVDMTVDASLSPLQLKSPVKTAYTKAVATGKASRQLFNDSDDEEHRPIQQDKKRLKQLHTPKPIVASTEPIDLDSSDEDEEMPAEGHEQAAAGSESDGGSSSKNGQPSWSQESAPKDNSDQEDSSESEAESEEDKTDFSKFNKKIPAPAAASPVKSPAASPIKPRAWTQPVGIGVSSTAGNGGKLPLYSKSYHVRVLLVGDIGMAVNTGSRVARRYVLVVDMAADELMLLCGYGDDATKHLAALLTGKFYTLDLISRPATPGKPLCIATMDKFYRLAENSKIRPYVAAAGAEDLTVLFSDATVLNMVCKPITDLTSVAENEQVSIAGVVTSVTSVTLKFSTGTKVVIADGTGYVSVMYFEGKANLVVGATEVLIGAKVWINPKTNSKELSVYPNVIAATNVVKLSSHVMRAVRDLKALVNVSAIPCEEVRSMADIRYDASQLAYDSDSCTGTVLLKLDPIQPANGRSPLTFNACLKCRKKIKPTGEVNENGEAFYDHDNENTGVSHKLLSYNSIYFFNGRFMQENDEEVYLAQVNDELACKIFGVTAEELSSLEPDSQLEKIQQGAAKVLKYNVSVLKTGDIKSIVLIE